MSEEYESMIHIEKNGLNKNLFNWKKINRNELMNKKHKKVCGVLSYTDHSLIVISAVTACDSVFLLLL